MAGLAFAQAVMAGVGSFTGDILDPQSEGVDETKGLVFGKAEGFGSNAIKFVPDKPRKTDGGGRARFDRIRARGGRFRSRGKKNKGDSSSIHEEKDADTEEEEEEDFDISDSIGKRGDKTPNYVRQMGRRREQVMFNKIPFIIPERVPITLNRNEVDTAKFANANYNMNASLFM